MWDQSVDIDYTAIRVLEKAEVPFKDCQHLFYCHAKHTVDLLLHPDKTTVKDFDLQFLASQKLMEIHGVEHEVTRRVPA